MIDDLSLQKEEIENIKMGVLRKFPLLGVTMMNLKFEPTEKVERASTDNEFVYFSPKYMDSLNSYGKKVFVFSHEIMHVALDHILRSAGKNFEYWNRATDAVINQMLIEAGLPMIEDCVDIEEASGHSADEMYEIFMKEKEEQEKNDNKKNKKDNGEGNQQQGNQGQNDESEENEQAGHGEHKMWKEVLEKIKREKEEQEGKNNQNQQGDEGDNEKQKSELEKIFTQKNEALKEKLGEQIRKELEQRKNQSGCGNQAGNMERINEAGMQSLISWQKLLKQQLPKPKSMWSSRRADEENYYCARIETLDVDELSQTEVVIDTSGSIDNKLIRYFLSELITLLKTSKIKVGCFDTEFYGFTEVTAKNIKNLKLKGGGGTDFDVAVNAFSKRAQNRIVFTDGEASMPSKKVSAIWIVVGTRKIAPAGGKVINIEENQIKKLAYATTPPERSL